MCENNGRKRKQRTSFDYGYDPYGDRTPKTLENRLHRRAFSDRREYKRLSDSRDSPFGPLAKKRRISPHPMFDGYQLVGDSLLLRFAEQVLFERCIYEGGMRYLGLCVSGQTIEDLIGRIEDNFSPVGEKIILLIGTNNIIQNKDSREMTDSLKKLLGLLYKRAKKIVILTIPPIPKFENSSKFWYRFNHYNSFICSLGSEWKNVVVQNISELYLDYDYECKMEFFEKWYDKSHQRPDLIHLNRKGLIEMKNFLQSKVMKSDSESDNENEESEHEEATSKGAPNLDSD